MFRNLVTGPRTAVLAAAMLAGVAGLSTLPTSAIAGDDTKQMDKMTRTTGMFQGAKANTGTATLATVDGKLVLTLSDDFKVPETPAPHWQVVDSQGNTYLLNRLKIKGDKFNKTITLPAYIKDVQKVQIWCSYAEALLGEASF